MKYKFSLDKGHFITGDGSNQVIEDDYKRFKTNEHFDCILELCGHATTFDSFKYANEHRMISSTGQLGNKWDF